MYTITVLDGNAVGSKYVTDLIADNSSSLVIIGVRTTNTNL